MKTFSRRDLLKTSLLAPAVAAAQGMGPMGAAIQIAGEASVPASASARRESSTPGAGRERLLLDFGWRFHFGNADDPAKDFGFGSGRTGNFQKTGNFLPAGALAFDDGDWRARGSASRLGRRAAFQERSGARQQRVLPAGTELPGHERRLVSPRLRASRRGRRQANHHRVRRLVPRDDGGLQRLLHRPAQRRIRSVQLRCDRLCDSGRQERAAGSRGCHLERRLVLRGSGNLPARLAGEDAPGSREASGARSCAPKCGPAKLPLSIRTEVDNHGKGAQSTRVISTILDPSGKAVGKAATAPASIPEGGDQTYEQEIVVKQPALWSLEERNLYKLVTEVESGRRGRRSLRDAVWHSHGELRRGEGLLPERQVRQAEGNLQPPGPRRAGRGAA